MAPIARRLPGKAETLTPGDPTYPAALRTIPDPPPMLYVRGRLQKEDEAAVAIVGARRASAYGVAVAEWLGRELARCGVTVVSGLARGIDGAAHRGTLQAGGRTVAVLGCGVDVVYPPEHRRLMEEIIKTGAVVSEFPPGTPPLQHHFPQRNRIISGLSLGVVVVEGRERSGALVTADCALEQGREVFAVPGRIFEQTSQTPHRLVQEGAKLVMRVEDILDELRLPGRPALATVVVPGLQGAEAAAYAQLSLDPLHVDTLAQRCKYSMAEVTRALTMLELRGLVQSLPGQRYVRVPRPGGRR